jgi:hypothetical protein
MALKLFDLSGKFIGADSGKSRGETVEKQRPQLYEYQYVTSA